MTEPREPIGYRVSTDVSGVSRTKQSLKDQTDLNIIVKRHTEGARIPLNPRTPMYGDFSGSTTLREALELGEVARADFMTLPADVRTAALNDPVRFLEMMATQEGAQLLVDAGLPIEGRDETPDVVPERVLDTSVPAAAPPSAEASASKPPGGAPA